MLLSQSSELERVREERNRLETSVEASAKEAQRCQVTSAASASASAASLPDAATAWQLPSASRGSWKEG